MSDTLPADADAEAPDSCSLFQAHREAAFLRRPNRFLIIARAADGEELACHCPNPGRMLELLLPGAPLILERRPPGTKTGWTVVATRFRGAVVPLFSARTNLIAQKLLIPQLIPDLRELRAEYTVGASRFDFFARDATDVRHLIEVKACSLVADGTAMFPDAPSVRARRHLEELAALAAQGYRCHVLFVIVHGGPERFMPNPHTDPAFAAALARCAPRVDLQAALVRAEGDGTVRVRRREVPVDLAPGVLAGENRGSYLVLLEIAAAVAVAVGALGTRVFPAGWYVYAGSARRNLRQRLARHLRRVRKRTHWHLDYLTPRAGKMIGLPIASGENLECGLARGLAGIGGVGVAGFGCSDCSCDSHLYRFDGPPLENPAFLDLLLRFRHREAFSSSS